MSAAGNGPGAPAPMSRQLPGLFQLVGGYLHRDWTLDYSTWEEAVDAFTAEKPERVRSEAAAELRRLVEGPAPEAELARVFAELDLNVSPEARGLTYREWLGQLLERLEGGSA